MKALADAVDEDGDRIVVFNPLPWPRSGQVVGAELGGLDFEGQGPGLLKDQDGAACFYARAGSGIRFKSTRIAPMGYQTLTHEPAMVNVMHSQMLLPEEAKLGNYRLTADLDVQQGTIRSLKVADSWVRTQRVRGRPECVDHGRGLRLRTDPLRALRRGPRGVVRAELREDQQRLGHERAGQAHAAAGVRQCRTGPLHPRTSPRLTPTASSPPRRPCMRPPESRSRLESRRAMSSTVDRRSSTSR